MGDANNGASYACVAWGVYGKSLYLPLNFFFFLKQKTVLQNIFKKKTSDIAQASTFGSLPTLPHSILVPWSTNSPLCNHSNFLELKCGHVASD